MYAFLDDRLEVNYGKYLRFQRIFAVGFGISFLIASIGLLGLAAHTCERRRKEIGIRKVSGASIGRIAILLGAEIHKAGTYRQSHRMAFRLCHYARLAE